MEFYKILKELRLERGYTQMELAKKADLATSCIAMFETQKREPTAHSLIAIANALSVSADYLLGLSDELGAPTYSATLSQTNSDETKLLQVYRSLSPDMKQTLWSLLNTWTPEKIHRQTKKM